MTHIEEDITTDDSASENQEKIPNVVPLYKLSSGVSAISFGIPCAKLAGIPSPILERAHQVSEHIVGKTPIASLIEKVEPENGKPDNANVQSNFCEDEKSET